MLSEIIDFTECKRVWGKAYNGANGKKIAIEYDGEQYMLKFPPSAENKPTELSYTNSCISEHIACSIFNMLGVSAQKTLLGEYKINGKKKIVCACKDFTIDGNVLFDFCSIKNTIIDSEHNGNGTELSDILDTIEKQQFVDPNMLMEHFWNVFVIDAFLGNFDRHNGNWGFLYNERSGKTTMSPIYDCGSCLLPQADEGIMALVLENNDEMNARIFNFPTSAIKFKGKKINYYDFLIRSNIKECNKAIMRITPRINMKQISDFIYTIPFISKLQKDFYTKYISSRYEKVILPSYEHVLELKHAYTQEICQSKCIDGIDFGFQQSDNDEIEPDIHMDIS